METNLVVLTKPSGENGPNVEEYAQKFLEHIRKGGVENFALVIHNADHTITTCWANSKSPYIMIGALEMLKKEFSDRTFAGNG